MNTINFVPIAVAKMLAGVCITIISLIARPSLAEEPTIITLTQTPCQFLESEKDVDHGFATTRKEDCETINDKTGSQRLAKAKVFELKPGKYVFRVKNKNVPYPLGFWLRGEGLIGRARLPTVSGGGLTIGTSKDYRIELKAGEYVYSCPLNPTPDYKLIVKG